MFVDHLQLTDFRSYETVDLRLEAGVSTFVGANGQGKTNLVEAIEYLSTMNSHRVASEVPLIRSGAPRAVVRAEVQAGLDDPRRLTLELEINPGKTNRAKLNRSPLRQAREIVGLLRTVVFAPGDIAIVKGDPSERRRFLDDLLVARWPRLAGVRADYERALRQRNTLLKSLSGRLRAGPPPAQGTSGSRSIQSAEATLDVWDTHLAQAAGELLEARLATLGDLAPHVSKAYADIAPTNNNATAEYRASVDLGDAMDRAMLRDLLSKAMTERRNEEIQRGVSLVGPHRDDIALSLGMLPAKGYASHGESWSLALALRLGSFHLLRADGVEPVLVLDDVFAELDWVRRERLASGVRVAEQVLVTAAVGADVPELLAGRRFRVVGGEVKPDG
ncbi:MAG TPA: DNA replication/repair protein RecF [Propionibacteriaceae bacterium]|nr:DNA replication/repair protein RecF [Propionibacteriaceae bacterium]